MLWGISSTVSAAPNVIQVVFYQDNDVNLQPNYVLSNNTTAIEFTAVIINWREVESDVHMEITGPDGFARTYSRESLGADRYGFRGSIPARHGNYQVRYYSNTPGKVISIAENTPTRLGVHYRASATLSQSNLRVGSSNITLNCTIRDRFGTGISIQPQVSLEGGSVVSGPYYHSNGSFTLDIGQVTAAGSGALKLLFDGVEVANWDVATSPFPALTISPGAFYVDRPQQITINAKAMEFYYNSFNLQDLDNSQIKVELSGVPIAKSSITRTPLYFENSGSMYGEETYRRLDLYASDLAVDAIRFTGGGILRMRLVSLDERYEKVVELPVLYVQAAEGLLGAPAYQSYAGEAELNLQFNLPNGKQVSAYNASVYISNQESQEFQESLATGYLHQMAPIHYSYMGRGTITVQATTTDRDSEVRDWFREFTFNAPILELSQTVIPLDEEQYLSVFLRDADGRGINDATVTIEGMGSRSSGSNGEYLFNGRWTTPGFKRVQAYGADGSLLADFAQLLKVQPPENLLLVTDTLSLMSGAAQTVSFTIIDETGRDLSGGRVRAYVDGSNASIISSWNATSRSYQVRVTPLQQVVFVAESGDGRRVSAELVIPAVEPQVVCNYTTLTNLFMERLEIAFVNPTTNEPLSGTMALRTQNVQIAERNMVNNTGGSTKVGSSFAVDLYKRILTGSAEPQVAIDFTYNGRLYRDLLVLPLGEAKINVDPSSLSEGISQRVSLEVLGAGGSPLPGLEVTFQGEGAASSVTNEQGRVAFNVTPRSGVSEYTFTLQRTDALVQTGGRASTVIKSVPVVKPVATPPTLHIENIGNDILVLTDQDAFILKLELSDTIGLDYLTVGARRIDLGGPTAYRDEVIRLEPGDNNVVLALYNTGGLSTVRELVIRYTPPPPPPPEPIIMHIGSTIVRQGSTFLESPPVPPQIINDRTVLPFRYLCQTLMGGIVHYEEATRRIYTSVTGYDIVMQVDNLVMQVNGVNVTLPQAPVIVGSYTLVPVRAFDGIVTFIDWDALTETVTIYP